MYACQVGSLRFGCFVHFKIGIESRLVEVHQHGREPGRALRVAFAHVVFEAVEVGEKRGHANAVPKLASLRISDRHSTGPDSDQ